jgi:hypothetical protein
LGGIDLEGGGTSYLFMPRLPEDYAVWMGKLRSPEEFKERYRVDHVLYTDEMPKFFRGLKNNLTILTLSGVNTDSGLKTVEADFAGKNHGDILTTKLCCFFRIEEFFVTTVLRKKAPFHQTKYMDIAVKS